MVGKRIFRLVETISFSQFFPLVSVFSRLVEKYFSTKSFIPAAGNGFPGQWKTFSFTQSFSGKWKPVSEINKSQFLRKDHILINEN